MGATTRSQSNHYETLELAPTASNDEIVQAFSAQMRGARMRPDISVARLAQLSVAYETLRDPGKRRAYDASLGLKRELTVRVPRPPSPFGGATLLERLNRVAEAPARAAPRAEASVTPKLPAESRVAAFIAASIREPVKRAEPEVPLQPFENAVPASSPEPVRQAPSPISAEELPIENGRPSIRPTVATLAAGVVGVAVLALALALSSRNPDRLSSQTPQAQPAVTVALPEAGTGEADLTGSQPALTTEAKAPLDRKAEADHGVPAEKPVALAATSTQDGPGVDQPSVQATANPPAADVQKAAVETPPAAASDASTEVAPAVVTSAKLPLPDATIARTIQRIGYACGSVISASSIDGADGAFKITCSSGDAYRAALVGGRYHFRRWGSH